MSDQTSDQKISELLDKVSSTQAALEQAQSEYDLAKRELEQSPLLASVGLQVIPLKKGRGRSKPWTEERKAKFSSTMKKRWADKKKAKK